MADNALKSRYGAGQANARRAAARAGAGQSNQTVLTPDYILDAVRKFWPEGIALDPCPEFYDCGPEYYSHVKTNVGAKHSYWNDSGLDAPWVGRTFCNPPYNKLKPWLEKSYVTKAEHIMLVPVRTHRKWFDLTQYNAVCFLDPTKFKGFKQAHIEPCCLLWKAGESKGRSFKNCFGHLGRCGEFKDMI